MFLAVAATEIEMRPLQHLLQRDGVRCPTLVAGVGPVETAVRLTRFLADTPAAITGVVNVGVAGGYCAAQEGKRPPALLDLYLAETETFGDLGLCYPDRIERLPEALTGTTRFWMDRALLDAAVRICREWDIPVDTGNFVTVAGASATRTRGEMLARLFQAQCENMEGAAVARVCAEFALPALEIRCISNLVEDRNPETWRLQEACEQSARSAAVILHHLME